MERKLLALLAHMPDLGFRSPRKAIVTKLLTTGRITVSAAHCDPPRSVTREKFPPTRLAMDWGALSSRDAVLAICEHFGIDFAQARDHLLARQLQQAEERAAAAAAEEEEEEEEAEDQIIPMPGHDLVSVSATVVRLGTGEYGVQDGAGAAAMFSFVTESL